MFRKKTEVEKKLARGERVTMREIVETYTKYESMFGRMMPTPESVDRTMRMVAKAEKAGLLVRAEEPQHPQRDPEQAARGAAAQSLTEARDWMTGSPAEVLPGRAVLSATNLDDVPESVRIGSPYDASDDEVWEAAQIGFLHPQTNYGVVYRAAFASRMEPREAPITMRVMFATACLAADGTPEKPTTDDAAWLLVTSRALRWHYCIDGVPGTASNPDVPRPTGPRDAEYAALRPVDLDLRREVIAEHAGPFGATALDFHGFSHDTPGGVWIHALGLSGGFETDALMKEIHERIAYAKG